MKDLINEQPEQDIDHCGNCIHSADSLEICVLRTCKYAIGELIDCYEPKQIEQRWIPCSERLPEDYQSFYATCKSNIDNRENWVIEGWYSPWRGFNPPPLVAEMRQYYPPFGRRMKTRIRCTLCRCNSGEWGRSDKAIEAWNRRVSE